MTDVRAILVVREALLDVNRELCATIGPRAVGLAGDEIGLRATPVPELGCVGTPLPSAPQAILDALADGLIPVVAPLARGAAERERRRGRGRARGRPRRRADPLLTDVPGCAPGDWVARLIGADEVEACWPELEGGIVPKLRRP